MTATTTSCQHQASTVRNRLKALVAQIADGAFLRNVGSFAAAEVANKITRIAAMVIIARSLSVEEIGFAAIAITTFELVRTLTNNGIGQMIVRANDDELESVCRRAHQLNFMACGAAGVVQVVVGLAIWQAIGNPALFWMTSVLSLVFLGMPFGLVRIFRAMRRNRMDLVARINFYQISSDNALSLVLAILGFGAWAIVLPKLLTFPIWLICARRSDTWRPNADTPLAPFMDFRRFCAPLLASEILKGGRLHLDKAVIVALLGVEALGIYFFAFNAGLGLAQTLSVAFSACLYPQLCKANRNGGDLITIWTKLSAVFLAAASCVFLFQIAAAKFYVPIVFGESWRSAVPIVVILCFAALPRFLSDCVSQLARAASNTSLEARATLISGFLSIAAIAVGAQIGGLTGAAIGLAGMAWVVEPVAAVIIRNRVKKGSL